MTTIALNLAYSSACSTRRRTRDCSITRRALGPASKEVRDRHVANCTKADPAYSKGVVEALELFLAKGKNNSCPSVLRSVHDSLVCQSTFISLVRPRAAIDAFQRVRETHRIALQPRPNCMKAEARVISSVSLRVPLGIGVLSIDRVATEDECVGDLLPTTRHWKYARSVRVTFRTSGR